MRQWKIFAVCAALTFFFFRPVIGYFFVSDDFDWLHIAREGESLWKAFVGNYYGEHGVGGTFRPIVNVFFETFVRLFGLSPMPYHVAQLAVHAFNAFLVYRLARLVWPDEKDAILAWIATLFFIVMPQHTEAVVWIAAIGDPLATAGMLGSLLLYIRWRADTTNEWNRWISMVVLGGALLTKETALTVPLLILGYEIIVLHTHEIQKVLNCTWIYFAIAIGYLAYRWWAIAIVVGYYAETSLRIDALSYLYNFIAYHVGSLIVGEWRVVVTQMLRQYWYLYLLVLGTVLAWVLRWAIRHKEQGVIFAAYFWFVNIGLVIPLQMSMLTDEGERYGYVASVGITLLVGWIVVRLIQVRVWLALGIMFVLMGYNIFQLEKKLYWWGEASRVSESIVAQLAVLPFEQYQKNYLVGLPDTLYGAPILRNGAVQATALLRRDAVNVERIPVYTYLSQDLLALTIYDTLQRLPDGAHLTTRNELYLITGNATESHPEYRFELWNYQYFTNLSNTIRVQFQGGREYDWARGDIALWYYEEGVIKQFIGD